MSYNVVFGDNILYILSQVLDPLSDVDSELGSICQTQSGTGPREKYEKLILPTEVCGMVLVGFEAWKLIQL
jgi:hypothetical protein